MTILRAEPKRWTADEFNRMAELGLLAPGERVELIEGEIVAMTPQNPRHSSATALCTNLLVERFGRTHLVRVQLPLSLGELSEPEPDFALVPKESRERPLRHPSQTDLVIELADSSLAYDRHEKASLYAKAGVREYWVLNLVDRCLEIHLSPFEDAQATYGWGYAERQVVPEDGSATPRFLPPAVIRVREMLGD